MLPDGVRVVAILLLAWSFYAFYVVSVLSASGPLKTLWSVSLAMTAASIALGLGLLRRWLLAYMLTIVCLGLDVLLSPASKGLSSNEATVIRKAVEVVILIYLVYPGTFRAFSDYEEDEFPSPPAGPSLAALLGVQLGSPWRPGNLAAFIAACGLSSFLRLWWESVFAGAPRPPATAWVGTLSWAVFMGAAAAVAFRSIRRGVPAAAVAALIQATLQVTLIQFVRPFSANPGGGIIGSFSLLCGPFFLLACLSLAVGWIRHTGMALVAGAVAGSLASWAALYLLLVSRPGPPAGWWLFHLADLVSAALFAIFFWAGLKLARGRAPSPPAPGLALPTAPS